MSTSIVKASATPPPLKIEEARRLLAECVRVDEVKDVRDKAVALAAYYRERDAALEVQNDAAEIRLRSERRLGELLEKMPKNTGTAGLGRPRKGGDREALPNAEPTLGEIGITKKQSSVWQRIAQIAEDEFEERIAEAKENGLELTTSRVLKSKPPPEMRRPTVAPPPPPPSKAPPIGSGDDFSEAGHVAALIFEAFRPVDDLYERWPEGLTLLPLINIARDRLSRFEAWEREREKKAASR